MDTKATNELPPYYGSQFPQIGPATANPTQPQPPPPPLPQQGPGYGQGHVPYPQHAAFQNQQLSYPQTLHPQMGYALPATAGYAPHGQPTTTVIIQPGNGRQVAHIPGRCRECNGYMRDDYTMLGYVIAILCFPIGILCCLMMKERRCDSCGNVL